MSEQLRARRSSKEAQEVIDQDHHKAGETATTTSTDDVLDSIDAILEENTVSQTDIETLLNEIEGVLEVNAEEVVKTYVQRGGQ